MAKSPLSVDRELVKEFNIIEDLSIDEKILLVNAQIDEFRKVMFRNRIDTVLSQNLLKSADHNLASKGAENERTFRFTLQQMSEGLRTLVQFRNELEKEAE